MFAILIPGIILFLVGMVIGFVHGRNHGYKVGKTDGYFEAIIRMSKGDDP